MDDTGEACPVEATTEADGNDGEDGEEGSYCPRDHEEISKHPQQKDIGAVWPTLWAVNLFIVTPLPPSENETQLLG
jgi:hypothetical protein